VPAVKTHTPIRFEDKLLEANYGLRRNGLDILQLNLGKLCNIACTHCHVEAGPTKKRENMDRETAEAVVRLMDSGGIKTCDLTGGAPELNPHFKYLVNEARKRDIHVIDRCNLSVLFEPGQEHLAQFLTEKGVEIIASLPCYSKENVDKQRGRGTFNKSIEALLLLNRLGYGKTPGLQLNLVYNPVGAHLPPLQENLEKEYKERLLEDFGISFNKLFTITNMPIKRYANYLRANHQLEDYRNLLIQNFNPQTLDGLMCRNTLSVSWDGKLYDCDFNQMLGMQMENEEPLTIHNVRLKDLEGRNIQTANHCFGCTAGTGSSCQGSLS